MREIREEYRQYKSIREAPAPHKRSHEETDTSSGEEAKKRARKEYFCHMMKNNNAQPNTQDTERSPLHNNKTVGNIDHNEIVDVSIVDSDTDYPYRRGDNILIDISMEDSDDSDDSESEEGTPRITYIPPPIYKPFHSMNNEYYSDDCSMEEEIEDDSASHAMSDTNEDNDGSCRMGIG